MARVCDKGASLQSQNFSEARIEEILGLQRGAFALGDPEEGTEEEYQEKADKAWEHLSQYQSDIARAASEQGIEPELLIGILMDEYIRMYPRALGDVFGYLGLMSASMGLGQVKGDTARKLSEEGYYTPPGYSPDMSLGELQRLIADNPEVGINYAAAFIKYTDDLWGEEVWESVPEENKNAILLTLYSLGNKGLRKPGSEEWEARGGPQPSKRGTQSSTAGRKRAQKIRHGIED